MHIRNQYWVFFYTSMSLLGFCSFWIDLQSPHLQLWSIQSWSTEWDCESSLPGASQHTCSVWLCDLTTQLPRDAKTSGSNFQYKSHQTLWEGDNEGRKEHWRGGGLIEPGRGREIKHHKEKRGGLKMKSLDLFKHYEDREQKTEIEPAREWTPGKKVHENGRDGEYVSVIQLK